MLRKKFLFSVLCLFSILAGCAKKEDLTAKKTITVWHWMTDRENTFSELASRYEAQTGLKVNFELYAPSDAYTQKVRASAQASTLPDIFGILGEKRDLAAFIKAGHILELSGYLTENNSLWKNKFSEKALAVNEFASDNEFTITPGFYGIPIDVMTIQMLYNKDLFKKAGLNPEKPPRNWDEFIAAGTKLKSANIPGMVSGWGELWMVDCFASNYAFNIMGPDKVMATFKGEVPYTDPDWIRVLRLFKDMQESGLLSSGIVTNVNKSAEQNFANNRAAFAFNGSWCVNVYKGMNPSLNYAAILPPKVNENNPMLIWGGAGSSFIVNARSPNREEAVKFLKWLTDNQQQAELAKDTNNLPANKEVAKNIPPILAQFADDIESTTHPSIWPAHEFPAVIEAFDKGIHSIIIAEKTPEQVAQEVQKIKERELTKKKSR